MWTDEFKFAISKELRLRLADIGPCVNGVSFSFTERKSVYLVGVVSIPRYALDDHDPHKKIDICACIFESMIRNIDHNSGISVRKLGSVYPVTFRAIDIKEDMDRYCLYVRCITEDMDKPIISDHPATKISNALTEE